MGKAVARGASFQATSDEVFDRRAIRVLLPQKDDNENGSSLFAFRNQGINEYIPRTNMA